MHIKLILLFSVLAISAPAADVTGDRLSIGLFQLNSGAFSSIGGGIRNTNLCDWSVISGGGRNVIRPLKGLMNTISGGDGNQSMKARLFV